MRDVPGFRSAGHIYTLILDRCACNVTKPTILSQESFNGESPSIGRRSNLVVTTSRDKRDILKDPSQAF